MKNVHPWESNPRPSKRESPPITTRPGLLPQFFYFLFPFGNPSYVYLYLRFLLLLKICDVKINKLIEVYPTKEAPLFISDHGSTYRLTLTNCVIMLFIKVEITLGYRHSSVDSSAPSILPYWVRVPSTPSMLLSIRYSQICVCIVNITKRNVFSPFLKK